jgi:hypothetical protein
MQARPTPSRKAVAVRRPPHRVDPDAIPLGTRHVTDAKVIVVHDARYRGATVTGAFELAKDTWPRLLADGCVGADVVMTWYGWRPRAGRLRIRFARQSFMLLWHYTGYVISGLGRPEW